MNRTTNQNKSRVLRVDNEAAANDGNRIRNILIFDNHPACLRLVRELYGDSAEPPLSQYYPLIYRVGDSWCGGRNCVVQVTSSRELALPLKSPRRSI